MKNRIVFSALLAALFLVPGISDARWMNPNTGRFQTMDSYEGEQSDPLSLHKYLYANADPANKIDPSGKWASKPGFEIHQQAIDDVLNFLPEDDRKTLKEQQVTMDEFQSSAGSYLHAMRSPNQTVEEAKAKANQWIRFQLDQARQQEAAQNHNRAMVHLGNAMHTLQDATSPSHMGFQLWDDTWGTLSKPVRSHIFNELSNPGRGSLLYLETRKVYDYFKGTLPMPADFFSVFPSLHEVSGFNSRINRIPNLQIQISLPITIGVP